MQLNKVSICLSLVFLQPVFTNLAMASLADWSEKRESVCHVYHHGNPGKVMPETMHIDLDSKIKRVRSLLTVSAGSTLESQINNLFTPEEFSQVSNRGLAAEMEGDQETALFYTYIAAIGGNEADQEKWSDHLLSKREYAEAARWYVMAAKNNNGDVIAYLIRQGLFQAFKEGREQDTEQQLAKIWCIKYPL